MRYNTDKKVNAIREFGGFNSGMYAMELALEGRPCLVVGGGTVAERKVRALQQAGATLTVIAPVLSAGLQKLEAEKAFRWYARSFQAEDVRGFTLVFLTTDDRELNAWAARLAKTAGAFVNVATSKAQSDFLVPSVRQKDDLSLAVSTYGQAPALARALANRLATRILEPYAAWLQRLAPLRQALQVKGGDSQARTMFWRQVLKDEVLDLVEQNQIDEAEVLVKHAINRFGAES